MRRLSTARSRRATGATLALLLPFAQGVGGAPVTVEVRGADGEPMPHAVLAFPDATGEASVAGEAIVDQRNKRFDPLVSVVPPGTLVRFPNDDDTRHHVYSFSEAKTFELKLYRANDAPPVRFGKSGLVTLGCNIHDNMKGYVLVSDNPSAAITDGNGVAILDGSLVEGSAASLTVWHPLAEERRTVALGAAQLAGDAPVRLALPFSWSDPQEARSTATLESLLRSFGTDDD